MRKEAVCQEENNRRDGLGPPRSTDNDELAVEASQPSVGDGKPPARPADSALPDTHSPHQDGGDDAAHEADLLGTLDGPVDGSADTHAVLPRGEEQLIAEVRNPRGEQGEEECVVAPPGAEFEVLGSQRRFEDEEVEVDHGRGIRRIVCRIASLARRRCRNGARAYIVLVGLRRDGRALDNGVDVGHGLLVLLCVDLGSI